MNVNPEDITDYCLKHSSLPIDLLNKIERETHLKTTQANMISGSLQGNLLGHFISMMRAKEVLEIGTFTGYSTIWMAENLAENGRVTTIEINPEIHWLANQFFAEYSHPERIHSILGDAIEQIEILDNPWDFILIDAAKKDNETYYDKLLPRLRKGAYIVIDNVLWKGKAIQSSPEGRAAIIDAFNKRIAQDHRVKTIMLPIRDGITLVQKITD